MPSSLGDLLTLKELQEESAKWRDQNFPGYTAEDQFIGVVEEVGELGHAYLKGKQGIRGTAEEHRMAEHDAVGDILIYLAGYCSARGLSMQDAMEYAWAQVKNRDWQKNKQDGVGKPTCERKRTDMTPCVVTDGPTAKADNGVCVGCGALVKIEGVD